VQVNAEGRGDRLIWVGVRLAFEWNFDFSEVHRDRFSHGGLCGSGFVCLLLFCCGQCARGGMNPVL
jgi:hypothetical protein